MSITVRRRIFSISISISQQKLFLFRFLQTVPKSIRITYEVIPGQRYPTRSCWVQKNLTVFRTGSPSSSGLFQYSTIFYQPPISSSPTVFSEFLSDRMKFDVFTDRIQCCTTVRSIILKLFIILYYDLLINELSYPVELCSDL